MTERLDSGNRIDIQGEQIIIEGNTYPIKDTLKALGMTFSLGAWRYTPKSDDDAVEFLRRLRAEFPAWDEREFGDLMQLL